MICYNLSDCVIEEALKDNDLKKGLSALLMEFVHNHSTPCKLAIDKESRAIDAYLAHDNPHITSWVEQMGLSPSSWEKISIDAPFAHSQELSELFKDICSNTADRVLIVHSHNGWVCKLYEKKGEIYHNGVSLSVLDKSEAMEQVCPSSPTNISVNNSIVATSGGCVRNARIRKKQ